MEEGHFKPGDRCDRYAIVRLVGAGGMGEVYEAVHAFTGHPVALKVLQLRHASKADILARMRHEAMFLSRVRHANMVAVHDADITPDGVVWIAMELLEGKPLREVMRAAGPMPVRAALFVGHEIADGLQAAHDHGVVHRDIKPENVFVTTAHAVKVLDLGAAKFHGWGVKTTDRMRTLGTPAYMSPEHLQGHAVDGRADQYALGLVLYEMIAGRHPFVPSRDAPPSAQELAALQVAGQPRPLPEIVSGCPAYVDAIVAKALSKDRDARYASMAALSGALKAAARRLAEELGQPVDALDPTLAVQRGWAPSAATAPTVVADADRRAAAEPDRGGAAALAATEQVVTPAVGAGGTLVSLEPPSTTAKGTLIQRGAAALSAPSPTLAAPSPAPRAPRDPRTQKLPSAEDVAAAPAAPRDPRTRKLPDAPAGEDAPPPSVAAPRGGAGPLRAAIVVGLAIGLGAAVIAVAPRFGGTRPAASAAPGEATASAAAPTTAAPPAEPAAAPPASASAFATATAVAAPPTPASAAAAPPPTPTPAASAGPAPRRPAVGLPSSGL